MDHCRDIELELVAFASGNLGLPERERVRNHLNGCADCRAELAREMNLRETLASLPRASAPLDLDDHIKAAIRLAGTRTPSGRNRRRLVAALAVAAACLFVAIILPGPRPASGPEPAGSGPQHAWTEQEIAAARQEVMFSLALTARVLDRTRKDTIVEVFANKLPRAVNESLKLVKPTTPGGNG